MCSKVDFGGHVGVGMGFDLFFRFHLVFIFLFILHLDRSCQTKVTKFNLSQVLIDKDVFRFEISVKYIGLFQIVESKQNLKDDPLDALKLKFTGGLKNLFDVGGEILQN